MPKCLEFTGSQLTQLTLSWSILHISNIESGRIISAFRPIAGEDWQGIYRPGGTIMSMDFNGNEHFQLWYVYVLHVDASRFCV